MPAAPPFLAHGRVLGAADRHRFVVAGAADVAADAFADLVLAAFIDLARQERIGDRGARRADEIKLALADLPDHGVGRGEAADADHGLARQLVYEADIALLVTLLGEASTHRIVVDVADVDVPQVRQVGEHGHDVAALAFGAYTLRAHQFVDGESHGHGAAVPDGLLGVLDHLAQQTNAIVEAASIFVGALVVAPRDELERQKAVAGIDADDVEAGSARPPGGRHLPAPKLADVVPVHRARLDGVHEVQRQARRRQRRLPAVAVHGMMTAVPQLDPGKRAMAMHGLGHERLRLYVVLIPERREGVGSVVRGGMDRAVFGADHAPAAFGLHRTHGCQRLRQGIAHARTVRHLVESIPGRHRPDADRLEQDVVARIARHAAASLETRRTLQWEHRFDLRDSVTPWRGFAGGTSALVQAQERAESVVEDALAGGHLW